MEISNCNAGTFQIFLDEFSKINPDELKIIVLDNAAFHKAKKLKTPKNIAFIFQPPYSPEVNPAEKMWAWFKRDFTNKLFKTMNELKAYLSDISKKITHAHVKQTCSFDYVFSCDYWTKI
jgi:transposase